MGTKFEGVDVLDFLGQVVELHTQHYKEDFDMDKELIQNLARNMQPEKCNLLWMSRPCGTYCLSEREVYLQDSNENKVWMFYHEQANDPILAYALTLDGLQDGKVTGTIYPLDYPSHVERVKSLSCPIDRVTVTFEDGVQFTLPYQSRRRQINDLCRSMAPQNHTVRAGKRAGAGGDPAPGTTETGITMQSRAMFRNTWKN